MTIPGMAASDATGIKGLDLRDLGSKGKIILKATTLKTGLSLYDLSVSADTEIADATITVHTVEFDADMSSSFSVTYMKDESTIIKDSSAAALTMTSKKDDN